MSQLCTYLTYAEILICDPMMCYWGMLSQNVNMYSVNWGVIVKMINRFLKNVTTSLFMVLLNPLSAKASP